MDDQSGRILALEAALADVQRTATAHDLMLRGILTHLALSEPDAFRRLIAGFARSGFYGDHGVAGELQREVAHIITQIFEEISAGVGRPR